MKISIITVCKNPEYAIKKTVESVLSQTYQNIEYIIIDGASTDGTVEYLKEIDAMICKGEGFFAPAKSFKFTSAHDTGIYNAMNKGIDIAKGDVLYFLNAGDVLFGSDVVKDIMNEFKTTSSDAVYGDILIKKADGSVFRKSLTKLSRWIFLIDTINHQALFAKTEIVRQSGRFDESYRIASDYDLVLKMFRNNAKIIYVPLIVASYPDDGVSSSLNNSKELEKERSLIQGLYFSGFEKFIVKLPLMKKMIRLIWSMKCLRYQ